MNRRSLISFFFAAFSLLCAEEAPPKVDKDAGKQVVAKLRTVLLYGTNGGTTDFGEAAAADAVHVARLQQVEGLKYSEYRQLGEDRKSIWRSYTNWASPMKGSEEILISFEPQSEPDANGLRLDLELWVSRRKIMKSTQVLQQGKWLYITGPVWRNGKLIIAVELLDLRK